MHKLLLWGIFVFVLFGMTACNMEPTVLTPTPTATERTMPTPVPQEVRTKTSGAMAQIWEATMDARPTSTVDTRSNFEKCVQSPAGVKYVITGEDVTGVSVTWQNDMGGTNQGDYQLPFCIGYDQFENGDFLYISAQIIQGDGSIECKIFEDTSVISQADASGFPSIATCSGSK